ncbi:MAG: cell division protein SepF [Clostridium sp.]|nr:MAG: cell division protein SepF [Clostridium sp.]
MKNDDERAANLVDEMKEGKPLVINLDNLEFIEKNKFFWLFFAGACYALGGRNY